MATIDEQGTGLPPRVPPDKAAYYSSVLPAQRSERCNYWAARIAEGWRPSFDLWTTDIATAADALGVYEAEWAEILGPGLRFIAIREDL